MNARVKIRTSAAVQADIDALKDERLRAERRIEELDAGWEDVLLNGTDAQAEQHQAERAKQERAIARVVLKLPPLEEELLTAREHEEAERKAKQQADATKLVNAAIADAEIERYYEAAGVIKAFLEKWQAATEAAEAAGVETPRDRIRCKPGFTEPDREESYTVYFDQYGNETNAPYPAGTYSRTDEDGVKYDLAGHPVPPHRSERRTRIVKGTRHPAVYLPDLPGIVNLPGVRFDDDAVWHASKLTEREEKQPRRFIL